MEVIFKNLLPTTQSPLNSTEPLIEQNNPSGLYEQVRHLGLLNGLKMFLTRFMFKINGVQVWMVFLPRGHWVRSVSISGCHNWRVVVPASR